MFSKLAYAMIKKWEIKLFISVNIYHRLLKLGMNSHFFQINLFYLKKWIKLVIQLIYIIDFQNLV